jgi:hypothetical protein
MLIAIYTKKLNETPKQSNLPKVDLESLDITSILYINNKNKNNKIILPKSPNCSAKAVNIKSV